MGPLPQSTLKDFQPKIGRILAPEFGPMSSRKAIPSEAGNVPAWRVRASIGSFLKKQAEIKKWKTGRSRQRDIDQEKLRGIVDGRACRA